MKDILLKYSISYGQLLAYFNGKQVKRTTDYILYSVNSKETNYTFYFFKNNEINCYCAETTTTLTVNELLYFLASSNSGEFIASIVPAIAEINNYDKFLDLITDKKANEILDISFNLTLYNDSKHKVNDYERILTLKPFANRILFHDNKICFPLGYENKLTNIAYLDNSEVNNNYGYFSSLLLLGLNKSVALFFSPSTLLNQANTGPVENYYYLLFSNNFNLYLVSKLRHFSFERNLPIEVFINSSFNEAEKLFKFVHLLLTIYSNKFESITFEADEKKYTLHFFTKNAQENIMPLIEFVNNINRRLIIYYNNELSIVEDDITVDLKLIQTEARKENNFARNSISFARNNDTLCVVLNEVLRLVSIDNITFKTIF